MKSLPANILLEKNKVASTGAWLVLLEIFLTNGTTFRLVRNNENIIFDGGRAYARNNAIGHWKMNDNADSYAVIDSIGTHEGTSYRKTNLLSQAGKINEALAFNGTSDYINLGYSYNTTFRNSFSVGIWVKPNDGRPAAKQALFGSYRTSGTDDIMYAAIDTNGRIRLYYTADGKAAQAVVSEQLSDGVQDWMFLLFVVNETTNTIKIYKNGVNQTLLASPYDGDLTTNAVSMNAFTSTLPMYVGACNGASPDDDGTPQLFFSGAGDNMILFNKALDDTEALAHYNAGVGTEDFGDLFMAFPFQLDTTMSSSKGEIPTVELKVSNVTQLIEAQLQTLNGGIGSEVKIIVVNSKFLTENYSELELYFDVLECHTNHEWVTFTLGAPSPMRKRFPLDRYFALHCRWKFKSIECGYVGAETTCNRTLEQCRARTNTTRFGGFPCMRSGGIKVV